MERKLTDTKKTKVMVISKNRNAGEIIQAEGNILKRVYNTNKNLWSINPYKGWKEKRIKSFKLSSDEEDCVDTACDEPKFLKEGNK